MLGVQILGPDQVSVPDLEDLYDELQRGQIYECTLRNSAWRLDGLQHGQAIYIDPRPAILETLVHELLHRRKPRWSERRVTREARLMLSRMDEAEIATWWRRYRKVRKIARPVDAEDE